MKRSARKVLDYLRKAGPDGATAWKIEKATGLSNAEAMAALEILHDRKLAEGTMTARKMSKAAPAVVLTALDLSEITELSNSHGDHLKVYKVDDDLIYYFVMTRAADGKHVYVEVMHGEYFRDLVSVLKKQLVTFRSTSRGITFSARFCIPGDTKEEQPQALQRNKAALFDALKAAKVKRIVCGWALPEELDVPRTDGRKHWTKRDAVAECWGESLFCAQFEAEGDRYWTASVEMLSDDPRKPETLSLPNAVMAFALGVDDGMISSVFDVSGRSYGWWLTRESFADCADPDGVV
jgi:hypothetical protein